MLGGFGFKIFRIVPGAKLYPTTRYLPDLEDSAGVASYVAVLSSVVQQTWNNSDSRKAAHAAAEWMHVLTD
ncbi:MAG: hypothetical protein H0U67_00835 [Gemmatimonadetes bacterium]|nr:hypothetical protein [Gemmatimonadota bacterium]